MKARKSKSRDCSLASDLVRAAKLTSETSNVDYGESGESLAFLSKISHLTLVKRRGIRRVITIYQQFLPLLLSHVTYDISMQ